MTIEERTLETGTHRNRTGGTSTLRRGIHGYAISETGKGTTEAGTSWTPGIERPLGGNIETIDGNRVLGIEIP
jgi:hypothetical protein